MLNKGINGMDSETKEPNKLYRLLIWLKRRAVKIPAFDHKLTYIIISLWLITAIGIMTGVAGTPTGLGRHIDLAIALTAHTLIFMLAAVIIGFLFSVLYLPIPRLFTGCLLYSSYITYFILTEANLGPLFSGIITGVWMGVGLCAGLIITLLKSNLTAWKKTGLSVLPAAIILFLFLWRPEIEHADVAESFRDNGYITPLSVENPSEQGSHSVTTFTYGNGEDNHRDEFRHGVELISDSVDASAYINEWKRYRTFFWGFDETSLPLNGRVWMPEGEGTFPLVLMVHGNHTMENFSDGGYGYLGELLASRGYIAVSVDQNFLNYSNWTGIPSNDMKLRAWLLMHHLLQVEAFHETPDTPFYDKVDLQRVSLIGHSRGGQAVAMVADYERWFSEEDSLNGIEDIGIEGVVAIAPTDRQVDDMRAELDNVSYLTLHGARDGDVHNYHGDRQYGRVSIPGDNGHFKAGVYIAEANHSQFNTDWGRMDMRLPGGVFLNRAQMMSEEEQRQVAEVYISAFLESAVKENDQYLPLFRDVRYGKEWLPNTQYITRFENSEFMPLVNYNRAESKTDLAGGVTAVGVGFNKWEIQAAENRSGNKKRTRGMAFKWEDTARYHLYFNEDFRADNFNKSFESIRLSIANKDRDMEKDAGEGYHVPQLDVEMETVSGETARVSLEAVKTIEPPIATQYTINPWFEDIMREGKYEEAIEPVFQNYELPVNLFKEAVPDFPIEEVERISLYFADGPGELMMDEIGFFVQPD